MRVPLLKSRLSSHSLRKIGVKSYNHFDGALDIECLELTYKYHLKSYIIQNGISYIMDWLWYTIVYANIMITIEEIYDNHSRIYLGYAMSNISV